MAKIIAIQVSAETKEAQKALEAVNQTLQEQEDILDETRRLIIKTEKLRDSTSKKDANRLKERNDKLKELNRSLKQQKDAISLSKDQQKKANVVVKQSIKDQRDYGGVLGTVDKFTGGAISGFQGMTKSIFGATKGLKVFTIALAGTLVLLL